MDILIQGIMREHQIPGMAVAIIQNGVLTMLRGYGVANVELSVPVSDRTVFEIASLTKPFTAMLTLMMVDDGVISLEDSITSYLDDPPLAWHPVKIRHILCHQSGIPSYTSTKEYWKTTRLDVSQQDILNYVRDLPLNYYPGNRTHYDNTGYYLLGLMLERVGGKSYGQLLSDRIFEPFGMNATQVNDPYSTVPNRASGYSLKNGQIRNKEYYSPSGTFSAGNLLSTVADLTTWEIVLQTETRLKTEILKLMWTPQESRTGNERQTQGFTNGMGWFLPAYPDRHVAVHNGSIRGFSSTMSRFITDNITVILLCNIDTLERPDAIAKRIAEHYVPHLADVDLMPPL
ncbi:MAG: serine hydrolase domain-containing protein [Elainellaceae cyanobacterium]